MHIGFVTTSFPRYEGDIAGNFVLNLARQLVELGVRVTVIAPTDPGVPGEQTIQGVSVERFDYFVPRHWQKLCYGAGIPQNLRGQPLAYIQVPFLFLTMLLKSCQLAGRCDVLHAYWSLPGVAAIMAGRLRGKPVILTTFGVEVYDTSTLSRILTRWALNRANVVVAISKHTRDRLFSIGSPAECVVIPFGIDLDAKKIPDAHKTLRRKLGLSSDTHVVFALGRLIERKGFEYLIDAMKLVVERTRVQLVIGGSGPCHDQLASRVDRLHLEDSVFLPGFIAESELSVFYQGCDVFVLPSVVDERGDTEGLGMVLLEAQVHERPVVGSNVGGIPDIIEDGKNGYLVEPGNPQQLAASILRILGDDALAQRLGASGRRKVQAEFDWVSVAHRTVALYREALQDTVGNG